MFLFPFIFKYFLISFSIFKNLFIYFNWRIITLQYCDDFCHISTWISHRYTCVPPHPERLFHLPPHPVPLGCSRALASGALLPALNSPWSSILHMIIYMSQCCSLKESHPCLLPLSPKVCSLIYWLFKSMFNVQNFVNLPVFPFFLISNFIPFLPERIICTISVFQYILRLNLWSNICAILGNVPCALEENMYSVAG